MLTETIATVNGAFVFGFKRNFGFLAAIRAGYFEHLTRLAAVASVFTFVAAISATHRLILEAS